MHNSAITWAIFLSALLIMSFTSPVYGWTPTTGWTGFPADTSESLSTYDFSTGAGVDRWAYECEDAATISTLSGKAAIETEFTSYSNITSSDDVRYQTGPTSPGKRPDQHFKFTIAETPATIGQLALHWEGYGSGATTFYIWNFVTGAWESIGSTTATAADAVITGTITIGISNYIDASGYLHIAVHDTTNKGLLTTDYVKVDVTQHWDITNTYYGNDGTRLYFRVTAAGNPETAYFRIFMDVGWWTGIDSDKSIDTTTYADYYIDTGAMVAEGGTGTGTLYTWTGATWGTAGTAEIDRASADVPTNTFDVRILLSDIEYDPAGAGDMNVIFEGDVDADWTVIKDRAPDTGYWTVLHANIPEIPWPLPLLFAPIIVISVYVLWKRRFGCSN